MNKYQEIDYLLRTIFSGDIGFNPEEEQSLLKRVLEVAEVRLRIEQELRNAFQDSEFSWKNALLSHDVTDVDSEEEGREYALSLLWKPVFSDEEPPAI